MFQLTAFIQDSSAVYSSWERKTVGVTKNKICIRATVSGKVQGVFSRDTTRQKAEELEVNWLGKKPF